jgi:hypothetical protein
MTNDKELVQVIVVENAQLLFDELTMPSDVSEYKFEWHPASHVRIGKMLSSTAHLELYNDFITLLSGKDVPSRGWTGLTGKAIIFLDLGLEMADFPDDYTKDVAGWLRDAHAPQFQARQEQGIYLAGTALKNEDWEGVIILASGQSSAGTLDFVVSKLQPQAERGAVKGKTERDEDKVGTNALSWQDRTYTSKRVIIMAGQGGLSESVTMAQFVVNQGITAFKEHFGSLERRLWPVYAEKWFENSASPQPHNYWELDTEAKLKHSKRLVRDYVHGLLTPCSGDCIHEHWFSDEEFPNLFEDLKSLVGARSNVQGTGGNNFTLGNASLVLAAVVGWRAVEWLAQIHWSKEVKRVEILPSQSQADARQAILSLAALFKEVSFNNAKGYLLRRVGLTDKRLEVETDFDCKIADEGKIPLLEKVLNIRLGERELYGGNTFLHWIDFMCKSAKDKEGNRTARCVANLSRVEVSDNAHGSTYRTVLEILSCK